MKHSNIILILSALLIPLMITNESLWLDEACTALFAIRPDFHSWWVCMSENMASEAQMPLAMLLAWAADKLLGSGEWQLRAINGLWAFVALLGLWRAGRSVRISILPLALIIQPYFWYYTNEARPYALQMAIGAWLVVAVVQFWQTQGAGQRWAVTFTLSSVLLIYTTMLAPVTIMACALPLAALGWRNRWRPSVSALAMLGGGLALSIPAAVHYLGTLARGAKGSQLWTVDAKALAYVIYETVGLTGLGPPVNSLRESAGTAGVAALLLQHAPQFGLAALCALALALVMLIHWRSRPAATDEIPLGLLGWPVVIGAALFFAVSVAIQKAFWARHLAGLFPFYSALLGVAAARALSSAKAWPARLAVGTAFVLLAASCFFLRFSSTHRKEDYRQAAALTTEALRAGKSVWWVGSRLSADYYRVPLTAGLPVAYRSPISEGLPEANQTAGSMPQGIPPDALTLPPSMKMPDLIVVNHRSDFDGGRRAHLLVEQGRYAVVEEFTGFTILGRKDGATKQ